MTDGNDDAFIACDRLIRIYQMGDTRIQALKGFDLLVQPDEIIAIVGPSGSGKTTLLNVLSGLDEPTAGSARVAGWDLFGMSQTDRLEYRRSAVGLVRQQTERNLLPHLSVRDNVMLPMASSGESTWAQKRRADALLSAMGVGRAAKKRPAQLSEGERRRASIAVALANNPKVLFADEPAGELDPDTTNDVFGVLRAAHEKLGAAVVIATRDSAVSDHVHRTVAIRDGRSVADNIDESSTEDRAVAFSRPFVDPTPTPPPLSPPTPKPRVHFRDAPARPTPEEQATAGHPLAGQPNPLEEMKDANPYTPRVIPSIPPRRPRAMDGGEETNA